MTIEAVIFDVEGPITSGFDFWNNLSNYARLNKIRDKLVKEYLDSKIPYKVLNSTFVNLLKERKVPLSKIDEIAENIKLRPGTEETFSILKKKYGRDNIGLVSAGLDRLITKIQKKLDIKHARYNVLEVNGNDYTGNVFYHVDGQNKNMHLEKLSKEMGVDTKQVAVVCDGKEDIPMCKLSGLSIAFNPMYEPLKHIADFVIEGNDLKLLLEYL